MMRIDYDGFTIMGIEIPFYGILGVFGFLSSLLMLLIICKKCKCSFNDAIYVYVTGFLGLITGAKLLYIIVNLPQMIDDVYLIKNHFDIWVSKYIQSGMVYYGGMIGCFLVIIMTKNKFPYSVDRCIPLLIPCYILFSLFGRLGCLLTGCCYGKESHGRFSVIYHNSMIAPNDMKLIPIQLYEVIFDLIIIIIFLCILFYTQKGELLLSFYLGGYAIYRFISEFYRGDVERGYIFFLSISQWISIIILFFDFLTIIKNRKRI